MSYTEEKNHVKVYNTVIHKKHACLIIQMTKYIISQMSDMCFH